ncbi:M24 family metallopeptidase [Serratia fonticola]|uniref:M24 family metallopeptidase n=1 Tax=Serratia fonticola TaxID=47917 RepID=UPI001646D43B|nr:M24 family metallopeptidase [Serratia fonticola]MBC3217038.1 M24 family metallopeptidase [Serratia fonticola]
MKNQQVSLKTIPEPQKDCSGVPVALTDETIQQRKTNILSMMKQRGLDQLVIYCDVEHGGNFEYLVGFFTRFEEALLIINADGEMTLVLGNENLNKVSKARIQAEAVHLSQFSLPNQPGRSDKSIKELLVEAGIRENARTGLVGWKMFTNGPEIDKKIYDLPSFIVDTIRNIVGDEACLSNETDLFIGEHGVRTVNNANEVAHYEYGAALASDCILDAMNKLAPGVTEQALGDCLVRFGQHPSIVTIASSGPRFIKGNLFPTDNTVKYGDTISLTVGYRGGASSRAGYAVNANSELSTEAKNYLDAVAKPYFSAYAHWLEVISVGMRGGDLFDHVEAVLPRSKYGWSLCPGHLTAEEEWMSSPIYQGSQQPLLSGMILQIDIIPSVPNLGGVSAESTVLLADEQLKLEIQQQYPQLWQRMQQRRKYLIETLGITLSADILPMCSTVAYLRPYLLDKDSAFVCQS